MASLRNDPLGKGMAQMLLDMPVEVPETLLQELHCMNFDFSDDQLAIRDAVDAMCADFGAGLLARARPRRALARASSARPSPAAAGSA